MGENGSSTGSASGPPGNEPDASGPPGNEPDASGPPDEARDDAETNRPPADHDGIDEQPRGSDPADLVAERDRVYDQLLRTAADFDNFRKRHRREVDDAERRGAERMLLELLPVVDNLERAVQAATSTSDAESVAEGVRMVLKLFEDTVGKFGVSRVLAVGERFDPAQHDAVQQVETADHEPGMVVNEIVPGYRRHDRILRPALVTVARRPTNVAASPPTKDGETG